MPHDLLVFSEFSNTCFFHVGDMEILTVSITTAKVNSKRVFVLVATLDCFFAGCSNHAKVINSRDISLIKRSYRGLHIDLPTFQPFPTKSRCLFKEGSVAIK